MYLQDISSVKTINCLYVDEEGRLWAGTNDSGVTIFINEEPINVVDDQNGLLSNSVKQIVCDSRKLLYRYRRGAVRCIPQRRSQGDRIIGSN